MLTAESLGWRTGVAFIGGLSARSLRAVRHAGGDQGQRAHLRAARSKGSPQRCSSPTAAARSWVGGGQSRPARRRHRLPGLGDPQHASTSTASPWAPLHRPLCPRRRAFTPRRPTSAPTWSARSRPASPRTTRAIPASLRQCRRQRRDIAGMGADIFESYVAPSSPPSPSPLRQHPDLGRPRRQPGQPDVPAALPGGRRPGCLAGRRLLHERPEKQRTGCALRNSTFIGAGLFIVGAWFAVSALGISTGAFWAVLLGTVAGICIGLITEYYTSSTPLPASRGFQDRAGHQHHPRSGRWPGERGRAGHHDLRGDLRRQLTAGLYGIAWPPSACSPRSV